MNTSRQDFGGHDELKYSLQSHKNFVEAFCINIIVVKIGYAYKNIGLKYTVMKHRVAILFMRVVCRGLWWIITFCPR